MKHLVVLVLLLAGISMARADLGMPKKPTFYDKLGEGIANIALAPAELFDSTYELTQAEGPTVGWTKGVVQGLSRVVMDVVMGAVEVVTSPIPSASFKAHAYDTMQVNAYPPADLYTNWY